MLTPKQIVSTMMEKDAFSQWLGITVDKIELGTCVLSCQVTEEMLNGFQILHGGISYSIADSALAFASNSYGNKCVSIETSISHTRPAKTGDILTATCKEINRGRTIGIYEVAVTNHDQKLVAIFKGTVSISGDTWE
jgi:acyl-CoA thioesterase